MLIIKHTHCCLWENVLRVTQYQRSDDMTTSKKGSFMCEGFRQTFNSLFRLFYMTSLWLFNMNLIDRLVNGQTITNSDCSCEVLLWIKSLGFLHVLAGFKKKKKRKRKAIWRCHLRLKETVRVIFHHFLTFYWINSLDFKSGKIIGEWIDSDNSC